MLVWGDGGVPAFMVHFLRQSEVTPSTMSQPSHLQQALWGQELGPLSLPTWSLGGLLLNSHSPHSCQDTLVHLTAVQVVKGRKTGLRHC